MRRAGGCGGAGALLLALLRSPAFPRRHSPAVPQPASQALSCILFLEAWGSPATGQTRNAVGAKPAGAGGCSRPTPCFVLFCPLPCPGLAPGTTPVARKGSPAPAPALPPSPASWAWVPPRLLTQTPQNGSCGPGRLTTPLPAELVGAQACSQLLKGPQQEPS